jgi:hypothetical protein
MVCKSGCQVSSAAAGKVWGAPAMAMGADLACQLACDRIPDCSKTRICTNYEQN